MPLKSLNDFVKIKNLSRGAQGEVTVVRNKTDNKIYALKSYYGDFDPAAFKEIEVLQHVEHPNIVQIYDYYIDKKGSCSLLLEYVEGQSLDRYISDHTELTLIQQLYAIRDTALGLQMLHDNNLIHCDIKPQNILVSRKQDTIITRLADFGIVLEDSSGQTSINANFTGTVLYMPPESFVHEGVFKKPTTDIYALGMVLYETLAKRLPFDKEIDTKFFNQIQSTDPFTPILEYAPYIPESLATITHRCIEKNRKQRYQTMQSFLHDYENCLTTYQSELTFPEHIKSHHSSVNIPTKSSSILPHILLGIGCIALTIGSYVFLSANSDPQKIHAPPSNHKSPTLEQGLEYFNNGNYNEAIHILTSFDKNSQALYHLGIVHENGYGTKQNSLKALEYYTHSANLGNPRAMIQAGKLTEKLKKTPSISTTPLEWYIQAAQTKDVDAMYHLGNTYMEQKDITNALIWLTHAAEKNHIRAIKRLAYHYAQSGPQYFNLAHKLYSQAAHLQDPYAMVWLGDSYMFAKAPNKNPTMALKWYQQAAELGSTEAYICIGSFYEEGIVFEQNFSTAIDWYLKADKEGHLTVGKYLGDLYFHVSTPLPHTNGSSIETAIQWYTKAAKNGDREAMKKLAELYMNTEGFIDYEKTIAWYTQLANSEGPPLHVPLKELKKRITEKKKQETQEVKDKTYLTQLQKRVAANDFDAMYQLGFLYLSGNTALTANTHTGILLLEQAAQNDHTLALYSLGLIYYAGKYVKQDISRAYNYFDSAAKKKASTKPLLYS